MSALAAYIESACNPPSRTRKRLIADPNVKSSYQPLDIQHSIRLPHDTTQNSPSGTGHDADLWMPWSD